MSPSEQPRAGRAATAPRQDGHEQEPARPEGTVPAGATGAHPQQQPPQQPRQPARAAGAAAARPVPGPRRVRLTVARVDPWSVMKLSFLLSVAIGIALVVAAGVLWSVLDGMGVFADVNRVAGEILADPAFDVNDYVGFTKVISLVTVIAVVDVVLITAIATLGAFLYNLATALVGGLHLTLSDD